MTENHLRTTTTTEVHLLSENSRQNQFSQVFPMLILCSLVLGPLAFLGVINFASSPSAINNNHIEVQK